MASTTLTGLDDKFFAGWNGHTCKNNNLKGGGIMGYFGLDQRQHAAGYTCNWTICLRIRGKAGGDSEFQLNYADFWVKFWGNARQTLARKSFRRVAQLTGNSEGELDKL